MRILARRGLGVGARAGRLGAAAALIIGLHGCAALALPLLAAGAGVGASAGVEYTLNGVAYRTFTVGLQKIHGATLITLRRMAIVVKTDEPTDEGRKVVAQAMDRNVEIQLQRLTANTTRMRIVVKQGTFFLDRATAGEILTQTGRTLGGASAALSQYTN